MRTGASRNQGLLSTCTRQTSQNQGLLSIGRRQRSRSQGLLSIGRRQRSRSQGPLSTGRRQVRRGGLRRCAGTSAAGTSESIVPARRSARHSAIAAGTTTTCVLPKTTIARVGLTASTAPKTTIARVCRTASTGSRRVRRHCPPTSVSCYCQVVRNSFNLQTLRRA